jgi:RNA polymerase sigma factor (sigma-70 family)
LKHYVRAIAFRICVNHHRGHKRRAKLADIEKVITVTSNPGPLDALIQKELDEIRQTALNTVLESAKPECLDLWLMRYWEKLPCEVVARVMGIAVGTVKSMTWRCIDKAKKALGLWADPGEPLAPSSDY